MGVATCWRRTSRTFRFQLYESTFLHLKDWGNQRTFCDVWIKGNAKRERLFKRGHGLSFCSVISGQDNGKIPNSGPYKTHTLYSDIDNLHLYNSSEIRTAENVLAGVDGKVGMLKTFTKEMFGHLEDFNLLTEKFHMLDRIVENVSRLEDLANLVASSFKHFNFTIKNVFELLQSEKELR